MKFENSPLSKTLHFHKQEMPFGDFYFFETFIISEIYEGVHLDWAKIEKMLVELIKYYGVNTKIGFISNRVNSYSADPQYWMKISEDIFKLDGTAFVCYNERAELNSNVEKHFSDLNIVNFSDLDEAITWITNLK